MFAAIAELAQFEGIAVTYLTRVLRLTLLTPDLVEARSWASDRGRR